MLLTKPCRNCTLFTDRPIALPFSERVLDGHSELIAQVPIQACRGSEPHHFWFASQVSAPARGCLAIADVARLPGDER